MQIFFKNKTLNRKYIILPKDDVQVVVKGYGGKLSDIPNAEMLEGMLLRGSNLVGRRLPTPKVKAPKK